MKLNPFARGESAYEKACREWQARIRYLSEHGPVKEYRRELGNPPQPEWYQSSRGKRHAK